MRADECEPLVAGVFKKKSPAEGAEPDAASSSSSSSSFSSAEPAASVEKVAASVEKVKPLGGIMGSIQRGIGAKPAAGPPLSTFLECEPEVGGLAVQVESIT